MNNQTWCPVNILRHTHLTREIHVHINKLELGTRFFFNFGVHCRFELPTM